MTVSTNHPEPRVETAPRRESVRMRATYRLQLHDGVDFDRARALVPYLRELGVSHLYLSPVMTARPGSTHGYDVTDPATVSPELGGERGLRRLARAAHDAGLGLIVDFVPNHMAADETNPYWSDAARRDRFFDVDARTGWHRRFFTIDDLVGVRTEDPEVFRETHATILALVAEGVVDGLRIDHPDGLADPAEYLWRLRRGGVEHVWVEKILEPGEELRDWPVEGTTGYEFAADVTALLVDPDGEGPMTELYADFTGQRRSFAEVSDAAKREQVRDAFSPELEKLRSLYDGPGLEEAVAALPVYRTYVDPRDGVVAPDDHAALHDLAPALRRVLELAEPGHDEFVTRFQQTTGAVMAKGVEDTAFYRYGRLVALNEVGQDPGRFSLSVAAFHEANERRAERFPLGLLASQTHDTKRSGDVRARLASLPGFAVRWRMLVTEWRHVNASLRRGPGPDPDEEYLIYQTLVGTWPIEPARLCAYLTKALREAKRNSDWAAPDEQWERSVLSFATALYGHAPFRASFDPFVEVLAREGRRASLAALLLQLTSPGVPDIYQGDELWSLHLVDPDNRRPPDWHSQRVHLDALVRDGRSPSRAQRKLSLIHRTLALRARCPAAFEGSYRPLDAPAGVCAFERGERVCVIVGVRPDADVGAVALPRGRWHELLPEGPGFAHLRLLERA